MQKCLNLDFLLYDLYNTWMTRYLIFPNLILQVAKRFGWLSFLGTLTWTVPFNFCFFIKSQSISPEFPEWTKISWEKLYYCFFCGVRFPNEPLLKAVWETATTFLIDNSFLQQILIKINPSILSRLIYNNQSTWYKSMRMLIWEQTTWNETT